MVSQHNTVNIDIKLYIVSHELRKISSSYSSIKYELELRANSSYFDTSNFLTQDIVFSLPYVLTPVVASLQLTSHSQAACGHATW